MTHSRTIAKVFCFYGYILLIPAILATLFSLLTFIFALIPIIIGSVGFWLLTKYNKHYKGELEKEQIIPLWTGTIIYNIFLLIPVVVMSRDSIFIYRFMSSVNSGEMPAILFFLLFIWQIIAILLSFIAIWSELSIKKVKRSIP